MTMSAPVTPDWKRWLIALLVIGSIRWLGQVFIGDKLAKTPLRGDSNQLQCQNHRADKMRSHDSRILNAKLDEHAGADLSEAA